MYVMGIDIGGTKVEVALLQVPRLTKDPGGLEIKQRQRVPTKRLDGYPVFFHNLKDLCLKVLEEAQLSWSEIAWLGLGLPGSVDPKSQVMLVGNSVFLQDKDIVGDLRNAFSLELPIFVANDANCFIWSEVLCGAGNNYGKSEDSTFSEVSAIGIILGTGVGGGHVWQGKIHSGTRGAACEFGHIVLEPNGYPCYCGQRGCAEQYLSGPAIEAAYATRIYGHLSERPSCEEIFALQQKGDPIAIAIIHNYRRYLAKFLALLVQCFDPTYFVLGGGVSSRKEIYDDIISETQRRCFLKLQVPPVLQASLGVSSGVVGAALLGFQEK